MLACAMNNWTISLAIVAGAFTVCTVAVCFMLSMMPSRFITEANKDKEI